ncbi:MAG: hypothetical protein M9919_08565 [Burkholderiaceae bacterium]|nr:hypothetical protein [Burkholderiaceae bacterium]MCO5104039.1 hypothetical protein [Burkholderiaceae bacterium]
MQQLLALVLGAIGALAGLPTPAFAGSPETGRIHLLLLHADEQPVVGATVRGACRSDDGAFFGGTKLEAPWSCTSDALGVCSAQVRLLPKPGSDQANACKALAPTEIVERGAAAVKSSYFTFFADGRAESFNLLQKGTSWKHGDYLFKSLNGQAEFDDWKGRNTGDYYQRRVSVQDDPATALRTLDTAAAHAPQSREYPNTEFLRARVDRKSGQTTVEVVVTDTYIDYAMHLLDRARYGSGASETTVAVTVGKQGSTCNMRDLFERKCTYQETVSFPVDTQSFRQAAASYQPDKRTLWSFQILAKSGHTRVRSLSHAEFHALAQAIEKTLADRP